MDDRTTQMVKEVRLFLLGQGMEGAVETWWTGMIEEGGATWNDQEKTLSINYPPDGTQPRHRLQDKVFG